MGLELLTFGVGKTAATKTQRVESWKCSRVLEEQFKCLAHHLHLESWSQNPKWRFE